MGKIKSELVWEAAIHLLETAYIYEIAQKKPELFKLAYDGYSLKRLNARASAIVSLDKRLRLEHKNNERFSLEGQARKAEITNFPKLVSDLYWVYKEVRKRKEISTKQYVKLFKEIIPRVSNSQCLSLMVPPKKISARGGNATGGPKELAKQKAAQVFYGVRNAVTIEKEAKYFGVPLVYTQRDKEKMDQQRANRINAHRKRLISDPAFAKELEFEKELRKKTHRDLRRTLLARIASYYRESDETFIRMIAKKQLASNA